ncbi:rCG20633 [Rattus norvegicus]|uniref:RCG20633 n=1 Tax=Rattus norvegicus TaxID=10116 RepID=A6JEM5_RAT|nr:rCG20633 [Rattus norvegicus]
MRLGTESSLWYFRKARPWKSAKKRGSVVEAPNVLRFKRIRKQRPQWPTWFA